MSVVIVRKCYFCKSKAVSFMFGPADKPRACCNPCSAAGKVMEYHGWPVKPKKTKRKK